MGVRVENPGLAGSFQLKPRLGVSYVFASARPGAAAKPSALCHTWAMTPAIRKTRPFSIKARIGMKTILSTLGAAFLLLSMASDAQAAACAHGARGTACAGPRGAAAVRKPYGSAAVVRRPPPRGAVVVPPRRGAVIVR